MSDPAGWVFYLSHTPPKRLVVFLHGFGGKAVSTWQQFPNSGAVSDWWRDSDMLFVGYRSKREDITGVADRVRRRLAEFYPRLPDALLEIEGTRLRDPDESPYRELFLVGHSLGGVVVRRALCDAAQRWRVALETDAHAPRPAILDSSTRLFSPASAGFRAAGFLGMVRALRQWGTIDVYLRRSSAYSDIQPGSETLNNLRDETVKLLAGNDPRLVALRASILWANPDDVVLAERYVTDLRSNAADGFNHRSVCKPGPSWQVPWLFVETGDLG